MNDRYKNFKNSLPNYVNSEEDFQLFAMRHSAEHILMQAMQNLYGKDAFFMAMGPATEDGFYFDFDPKNLEITEEMFEEIEKEIKKIIDADLPIRRKEISVKEARKLFSDNPYKQELLDEIEKSNEPVSIYITGDSNLKPKSYSSVLSLQRASEIKQCFVDLCAGPHVDSTGEIKAFKLLSIAGAYWHGDEKNKMLTRIYGTAFRSKKELDDYLAMLEEAEKRNHRKIGKEMELFANFNEVGQGLPVWLPNGYAMRRILEDHMLQFERKYGYVHVLTPHINKEELFETSGHLGFYKESMYSPMKIDNEIFYLKPMNCPAGMHIYKMKLRSYRDLPYKQGELGTVYRYEKSGELHGLQRVRGFTQNDAHIFCTKEQLDDQFMEVMEMLEKFYKDIGFKNYRYRLSLSDENSKKYVGDRQDWIKAEDALRKILMKNKVDFYEAKGEAAFYGPKVDVQAINVYGKEDSISTIQVDFNLPQRFDITYTDENGEKKRPFMIHRALIGSFERFFAFLIEYYAGKFPLWFAPKQIVVIPVSDESNDYAYKVDEVLKNAGSEYNIWIRSEVDERHETLQARIRDAELMKIPYILIVGAKEKENNSVAVRVRGLGDKGVISLKEFKNKVLAEIKEKSLELWK
mgnify:CR=1 FL=1